MRIVAVADTHTFQDDLGTLPAGDVLVHAGDMLRAGTLDELRPVADWLNAQPHRHKIIVPGNHDVCFQTEPTEARALVDATVLVDEGIELEGVHFWGSPWQPQHPEWG
ncbi:MAG: metallophosphoesterase, partial [bacterium]|nr:metallophosphoesterase [bacterium]